MIDRKSFAPLELQAVVYTPGLQFVPAKVLGTLLSSWCEFFDADPTVLPQFAEMPPEVPRIILASKGGEFRFQASAVRADLFWTRHKDPVELIDFLDRAERVFATYRQATNSAVNRVAVVSRKLSPQTDPAKLLAEHFCREELLRGPLNRPQEFEIHAHKVFKINGLIPVNSWVRCKTVTVLHPVEERGILLEQDFNTLAESDRDLSTEELVQFFRAVPCGFNEVLALYFPGGEDDA